MKPIIVENTKLNNGKTPIAYIEDLRILYRDSSDHNLKKLVIRNTGLEVYKGEVHAIIGESGSGKSVISSTLFGLAGANAIFESGKVVVAGQEVQNFSFRNWEKSKLRGDVVSAVFQNPMTTLNPTMKVGKQIMEGIILNKSAKGKKAAREMAIDYLLKTHIDNAEQVMDMYPHQLSGGMKQRVVISAIVACKPDLIIFDEPTTALDPTVQAEILEIIKDIIKETNMGAVFITHDLGVVASIADRISIMYAGQIVETGLTEELLFAPKHPYTWGLLTSMPDVNKGSKLKTIPGSVPGSLNDIKGDAFAPRNKYAMGIDFEKEPPIYKVSDTHFVKSWLLDENAPSHNPPQLIMDRLETYEKRKVKNAK